MPPLPLSPQQPDWSSNSYIVSMTRILVVVGVSFLARSLYQLLRSSWPSVAAASLPGELLAL